MWGGAVDEPSSTEPSHQKIRAHSHLQTTSPIEASPFPFEEKPHQRRYFLDCRFAGLAFGNRREASVAAVNCSVHASSRRFIRSGLLYLLNLLLAQSPGSSQVWEMDTVHLKELGGRINKRTLPFTY